MILYHYKQLKIPQLNSRPKTEFNGARKYDKK